MTLGVSTAKTALSTSALALHHQQLVSRTSTTCRCCPISIVNSGPCFFESSRFLVFELVENNS